MTNLTIRSEAPPAITSTMDVSIRKFLGALERHGDPRHCSISSRLAPTEDERSDLQSRKAELDRALTTTSEENVIRMVGVMRAAFPSQAMGEADKKAALKVYASTLMKYPSWVISRACRRFTDGTTGEGRFAPSAAEMARECEAIVAPYREQRHQIETILTAEVYREPTEEERQQVHEHFRKLLSELGSANSMTDVKPKAKAALANSSQRLIARELAAAGISDGMNIGLALRAKLEQYRRESEAEQKLGDAA
jgi:hypothetical protein